MVFVFLDMGLENINLTIRKTKMGMIFISLSLEEDHPYCSTCMKITAGFI